MQKKAKSSKPNEITERETLVLKIEFHQKMAFLLENYANLVAANEKDLLDSSKIDKILADQKVPSTSAPREVNRALSDSAKYHKNQLSKYKNEFEDWYGDAEAAYQEHEDWYVDQIDKHQEPLTDPDFSSLITVKPE